MFNLLPSAPKMAHLIHADWLEENGNPVLASAIRQKILTALVKTQENDNTGFGSGFGGGRGDGEGRGESYGHGDGYGNGDNSGNGSGYTSGLGFGDSSGNGFGNGYINSRDFCFGSSSEE